MCEDYNPTDNAIAESINGKIKVESVYRQKCFNSFEHAYRVIERYIHFYNYRRPLVPSLPRSIAQLKLAKVESYYFLLAFHFRNNKKRGHDTTSLKLNFSDCNSLEYHLSAIANINTLLRRLINLSSINCIGAIHFAD